MKVTLLLDTPDGHTLIAGTVFDLSVRVTHDDESPASNIPLQWATFRQGPSLDSHAPLTDTDGVASIQVTASPQPHAKPEPIFVQTPDGITHLIGSVRCRSEQAVIFSAASSAEAASPQRSSIASSEPAVSGGGPYRLTIAYPAPNSVLPADSPQPVYAQLLDNGGLGVAGATIEGGASTRKIDFLQLSGKTDAQGWATLWVRGVGLAEKAVDQLTGTVTATCKQYPCSDTKPLNFSTTAGGPGYFSLSLTRLEEHTPRLAAATYWYRDGSPAKYLDMSISAVSPGGGPTDSATTSPQFVNADDFGVALSYVTATANAGSQVAFRVVAGDAEAGNIWLSDSYRIERGHYAKSAVNYVSPPMAAPFKSGIAQQLSLEAPTDVSTSQVTWEREPRYAPVKLLPLGAMTAGRAQAQMTGTGTSTAYSAGITGTYYSPPDGSWHVCATAYAFYNGNVPPLDTLRGTITLTIPDGSTLSTKDWHTVDVLVTRYDESRWPNRVIHWDASVAKTDLFEVPYPSTTDRDGKCSIRIKANSDRSFMVAIYAWSPNPHGTADDTARAVVFFDTGLHDGSKGIIKISASDKPPLKPYVPYPLTANYTHAKGGRPFEKKSIVWSAFPSGQFEFSPNPSVTDAQGNASVTLTAVGDDYLGSVSVYARAYNDTQQRLDIGSLSSLSFQYGTPPTNSAHIALRPLDGDLISDRLTHLVEATYRLNEGIPLAGQPIDWTVEPADSIALQTEGSTATDENGVAINAFICQPDNAFVIATVTASATNPNTGQRDTSTMRVAIKNGSLVPVESQGQLTVTQATPSPHEEGIPAPLLATYLKHDKLPFPDQDLYWAAYSSKGIDFVWPSPTQTDSSGNSANNVLCSIGGDRDGVIVSVSSPNYLTGSYDFGQTLMAFVLPNLQGIMLDKPYARNPPLLAAKVDPAKPDQVVTGQILLGGPDHAGKEILISIDPNEADVVMFGEDNLQLAKQGTAFVAKTNADGVATFKVGALNPQLFSLQAAYDTFSTQKAQLTVALLDDSLATANLPDIQFKGSFNPVPSDTPTFQVFISDEWATVSGTDLVVVILNDVVVYYGPARNFFAGVDVAYALLSATNTISYLRLRGTTVLEQRKQVFPASGIAETGPLAGPLADARGPRTLQAPGIIGSVPIGPRDIVAGLSVMIPPYRDVTPGDIITAFVYLSGKYSLTARPIDNIATLAYTVAIGDALTEGKPMTLVFPQVYVAGCGAPGNLQADYKVTSSLGPKPLQWSLVAGPIKLNTTL